MRANLVLGLCGSLVTLVLLFEMMRRHRLREKYAVFWAVVAVFTILVALFPALLMWASELVGVRVPSNLLFFVASMVLLVVSVQHSHELGRLEDRSRTLAEEVGLLRMTVEETARRAHVAGSERGADLDPPVEDAGGPAAVEGGDRAGDAVPQPFLG